MLMILFTAIHVIVCVFLVIVVLLQSGKAADLAGAFGGMGSQTAFGPRGSATVLTKATTVAAGLFMVTSLTLSVMATRNGGGTGGKSVLETTKAPTTPAPTAAPSVTLTDPKTGKEVSTQPLQQKILTPEELKKAQEESAIELQKSLEMQQKQQQQRQQQQKK